MLANITFVSTLDAAAGLCFIFVLDGDVAAALETVDDKTVREAIANTRVPFGVAGEDRQDVARA